MTINSMTSGIALDEKEHKCKNQSVTYVQNINIHQYKDTCQESMMNSDREIVAAE